MIVLVSKIEDTFMGMDMMLAFNQGHAAAMVQGAGAQGITVEDERDS